MKKGMFIYSVVISYYFKNSESNTLARYETGRFKGQLIKSDKTLTAISIDGLKKVMGIETQMSKVLSFDNGIQVICQKLCGDGYFNFNSDETVKYQDVLQNYWTQLLSEITD